MPATSKKLLLRLVCKSIPETPAEEGALDVGIQDKKQAVHAGRTGQDGEMCFECSAEARIDDLSGEIDFRGPFVHGTPQARFLYLSWKRTGAAATPWYWRVKIPLASIGAKNITALQAGEWLVADITGRRPHASQAIVWKRVADEKE
jgi:hypothetical protein